MRNAECGIAGQGHSPLDPYLYIPHSTFRTPHWGGGSFARAADLSDPHRPLLHTGRPGGRGGGGVVRLSRLRPARRPIPREAAGARGPATLRGRPRRAVTLLSDGEPRGAPGRRELDDPRGPAPRDRRLRALPRCPVP